ncbi:polysialyltransferase family glycosyltransferase [Tenacibaculum sp.]|uniref:polysialyltransferase family glycosyltransferase n=1 Tax=Tenacibaculum sp. TaxID=1906242 RepID=UPI003D143B1E
MIKIAFVDSWSVGFGIVEPLIKELRVNENYELLFVHYDSLHKKYPDKLVLSNLNGAPEKLKKSQLIEGVDFSKYNYSAKTFYEIESPDLLVFISIHNLEQRYFLNIAKKFNIPSILVMHGVILKDKIIKKKRIVDKLYYPFTKINRLRYYRSLFKFFVNDVKSLKLENNTAKYYQLLFKIIFKREEYVNRISEFDSFKVNTICTISDTDEDFYRKLYNQTPENTKYKLVGHMDLHKLSRYYKDNKNQIPKETNEVVFFSQPYVGEGVISAKDYIQSLNVINKTCNDLGLKFIVRPHPRDDMSFISKIKDDYNMILSNRSLEEDLIRSVCVIGINSTVLLTANLIEKNIIILDFGFSEDFSLAENERIKVVGFREIKVIKEALSSLNLSESKSKKLNLQDPVKLIKEEIDLLVNDFK